MDFLLKISFQSSSQLETMQRKCKLSRVTNNTNKVLAVSAALAYSLLVIFLLGQK
jgi:hypothetical protein